MPTLTLAVSSDLKMLIDRHPEINCSEVARRAIRERLELLDRLDRAMASNAVSPKEHNEIMQAVAKTATPSMREMALAKGISTPHDIVKMVHRRRANERSSTRTSSSRPRSGRKA